MPHFVLAGIPIWQKLAYGAAVVVIGAPGYVLHWMATRKAQNKSKN